MSIKTSPQCEACNLSTETSNHKFYECPAAKSFWRDVLNWWNFKCPENITPSATEILYGYESKSSNFNAFNHHPLIAGYLIHLARLEANLRPRDSMFSLFFWKLKFNVKENFIAIKTGNHTKYRNEWTSLCISDNYAL